jgi:hypothetical protein
MNSWIFSIAPVLSRFILWLLSFTSSERVALCSAFLVLLGVIGEEVVELSFLDGARWKRTKANIKRWSIGILIVGLAGDALGIVMGQAEIAALIKEAGDAKTSAEIAVADAAKAHIEAGKAVGEAGEAETKAGDALGKVASVEGQAEEISQRLTKQDLRSHLLATKKSRDKFRASIKPFRGQKFDIRYCPGNDNEIEFLSLNLMGTIAGEPTGWIMQEFDHALGCGTGLVLLIDKEAPASTKRAAEALQRALFDAGLVVSPKPSLIGTLERRPPKTPDERLLETSSPDAIMILVQAHP